MRQHAASAACVMMATVVGWRWWRHRREVRRLLHRYGYSRDLTTVSPHVRGDDPPSCDGCAEVLWCVHYVSVSVCSTTCTSQFGCRLVTDTEYKGT